MTRDERIKFARDNLYTEHSKQVFDEILKLYPDTLVWPKCGDEEEEIWLEFKDTGTIIAIAGYTKC